MSSEGRVLGAQQAEFTRKLEETQAQVSRLYRELLVTTFFPSTGGEVTIEEEEPRLIKPETPHQPGIRLQNITKPQRPSSKAYYRRSQS